MKHSIIGTVVRPQLLIKKISRKGSSNKTIGIVTLARNPSGTAEANILTLLHDFCDNSQTAQVTCTSKVL